MKRFGLACVLAAAACSGSHGGSADALYCSLSVAGTQQCYGYSHLAAPQKTAETEACTAEGGKIVDSCPSGYVGCCKTTTAGYTLNECYYAGAAAELSAACTGTWTGPSGMGNPDSGGDNPDGSSNNPDGSVGGQCTGTQSVCPKGCADLDNDVNNCGSCGYACPAATQSGMTASCSTGKCGLTCTDTSTTYCSTTTAAYCDNLSTSIYSCGACNHECSTTNVCMKPTCTGATCGEVVDTTRNGGNCVPTAGGSGVCYNGTCGTPTAQCDYVNASEWSFANGADTGEYVTTCSCTGNTMSYTLNGTLGTVTCTSACLTYDMNVYCF